MENTDQPTESSIGPLSDVVVLRVRVPAPLVHQLEDLVKEPSFRFRSLEHAIINGLWSFADFKMRQLRRLREDAEGPR